MKKKFPGLLPVLTSVLLLFFFTASSVWAQDEGNGGEVEILGDDDVNIGGDIFSDFTEDVEASQVLEDERFYRYSRFYSLGLNAGLTSFTGNRGAAYVNRNPTLGLGLNYFINFRMTFGLGMEMSKHYMIIPIKTKAFGQEGGPGLVEVDMMRTYFSFRFYMDTYDLGTAITYANPYLVGRAEVWRQTNKFMDHPDIPPDANGAFGVAGGCGLEFPIELKESYINAEFLFHSVHFSDTATTDFHPVDPSQSGGHKDLQGAVLSVMIGYVVSW